MSVQYTVRIQAIACEDDDGDNAAGTSAQALVAKLAKVAQVYATANINLVYTPAQDFLRVSSTLANRDFTPLEPPNVGDDAWDHKPEVDKETHSRARTDLARQFPGKLVIIFRNRTQLEEGEDGNWRIVAHGGSSSGANAHYVNMSSGGSNTDISHEVGHYLQLPHTFAGGVETVADAEAKIRKYVEDNNLSKDQGLDALDGDRNWVSDTPADAKGSIFVSEDLDKCGPIGEIPIPVTFTDGSTRTYTLAPNRALVMSYFKGCPGDKEISPQQARRVRDGLELRLRNDLISIKPSSQLKVSRGGSATAGAIADVDLALVRGGCVVTAVRLPGDELKLISWDIDATGETISRRASLSAGAIGRFAVCGVGLNMVATAVILPSNDVKVIVARVEANGDITRLQSATRQPPGSDVAVALLTRSYIVTAVRNMDGSLGVNVWRIDADGSIKHKASADAGGINVPITGVNTPRVCVASLGAGRFVTPVRDVDGQLKLILWNYNDDDNVIERVDSTSPDVSPAGKLSICALGREIVVTAVENASKNLELRAHECLEDGESIDAQGSVLAGGITDVEVCRIGAELAVTAVRGSAHLKVILWQVMPGGNQIVRLDDASTTDEFTKLALCHTGRSQFATAFRDASGNLKLIAWRLQGRFQPSVDHDVFGPIIAKAVTRGQTTAPRSHAAAEGACDEE